MERKGDAARTKLRRYREKRSGDRTTEPFGGLDGKPDLQKVLARLAERLDS